MIFLVGSRDCLWSFGLVIIFKVFRIFVFFEFLRFRFVWRLRGFRREVIVWCLEIVGRLEKKEGIGLFWCFFVSGGNFSGVGGFFEKGEGGRGVIGGWIVNGLLKDGVFFFCFCFGSERGEDKNLVSELFGLRLVILNSFLNKRRWWKESFICF